MNDCSKGRAALGRGDGAPEGATVRFLTLGCRLNQAEEAMLAGDFARRGWRVSFEGAPADVVVLRGCAVTRQAERSTLQALRALKRGRAEADLPVVVATGCATAALPAALLAAAGADLVVPKEGEPGLCGRVLSFLASGRRPMPLARQPRGEFPSEVRDPDARPLAAPKAVPGGGPTAEPLFRHQRALLKVQDGCDFRCSYCIVPFLRGASVSRGFDALLGSARRLLGRGFGELALTGCNLACYRDGDRDLADLASAVCDLAEGSAAVSLGSLEPALCDGRIVEAMRRHANFTRTLHLPIQSGDSRVLALAGRRYTGERIREILSLYRASLPGLSLGGDFITGLPGEDEAAFGRTCDLVRDFAFDVVHVFPYSPRQGTAALSLPGRPSRSVAKLRAARLRALAREVRAQRP